MDNNSTKCIVSKQLSGMWAVKNKTAVIRVGLKWFDIVHGISKECQHPKIGNLNQYSKVEGKNKTKRHEAPRWLGLPIYNSQLGAARHVTIHAVSRVNELLTPYLYCFPLQ